MTTKKRAFTLIELLVVIAIIAILAAILFPVFAQAKQAAIKSQVLSNTKQSGLAALLYAEASDDAFPMAGAFDSAGNYLSGPPGYRLPSIPAGWGVNSSMKEADSVSWQNSTQPFRKNYELLNAPGLNVYTTGFNYATAPGNLPVTSLSMNGLLSTYPAAAVATPSKCPLLWWGNGKEAYRGYGYTSPYMRCGMKNTATNPGTCRFNPSGSPGTDNLGNNARQDTYEFTFVTSNDTTWVVGEGVHYVATDSSAKWVRQPEKGFNRGSYDQVAFEYDNKGNVVDPARCVASPGAPPYLSWFRPDSTYQYRFGNTAAKEPCFP